MLSRQKNRLIAKAITKMPSLARFFIDLHGPWEFSGTPWAPPQKPLAESTVAIVTTAGVHHMDHIPFDMDDRDGDPSFRTIDASLPMGALTITHDYYDHADADKDINIVFPIDRLKELEAAGLIGKVSNLHLSFMGHITGPHLKTLTEKTSPDAAQLLRLEGVDIALLTPG